LYPAIEPFNSGFLEVDDVHRIYYEECGNPQGKPAIFLHGGPGGGCTPEMRRFWNPERYRIVLFDQRGAGRSTPHASLENNTTWDLVADIERLRTKLEIDRWQVFGGSWGSTLALAYSQAHPDRATEIVLRGVFLVRSKEIHWFYQHGASELFPDLWQGYLAPIPVAERDNLLAAYHKRLTSDDEQVRLEAARAWSTWEGGTLTLLRNEQLAADFGSEHTALSLARIECHYFVNQAFLEENQLIGNVDRIRDIPCVIVHGRYDVICPAVSAWELARAWPQAKLHIVPDAGHAAFEPGIVHELVTATDAFA
jgi:proline iminopeptidase